MSRWHHLYMTKQWKLRRAHQLWNEPLCRMCQAMGKTTPATVADHVTPHRGDEVLFFWGDLQSLCEICHNGAKAEQERTGRLRGSDESGRPLDPDHPWSKERQNTPRG